MAQIEVACPSCSHRYAVDENVVGRRARCKNCDTRFVLTGAAQSPAPEDSRSANLTSQRSASPSDADGVPEVWKPGDVILDLYEVKEVLGQGGFGTVFKVHHRGWNMDLAVKSPLPTRFRTERDKERFVQECETWVNLGLHPHTVSCHYVRILGGIPRVFAEYVEGGSLKDWIGQGRLLPSSGEGKGNTENGSPAHLRLVLDLAIQIAWGMSFAHSKGLIHCDLKPANVLMTADGTAKVTDFGLARHGMVTGEAADPAGGLRVSLALGTPGYGAPEQWSSGASVTHHADIFAFGVTLWNMLGGSITWSEEGRKSVIAAHSVRALLKSGMPGPLPQALVDLILRCLEPAAADRWSDFALISERLRDIYAEEARQPYSRVEAQSVNLMANGLNNRAVSLLDLAQGKSEEDSEGDVAKSLQLFEEALQCDPHHVQATYNRAIALWHRALAADMIPITQLEEVRKTHADSWEAAYCLGLVHLERNDLESAVRVLEEAVRLGGGIEVATLLDRTRTRLEQGSQCVRTLLGHTSWVSSACLTADGRWALSGSWDDTLRLWEVSTGRCVRAFQGHTSFVHSVSISTDGRWALSGSKDKTLRLWEVSTGRCLRTFQGHSEEVTSVCLSADGRWALSGSEDKTLRLWEVSTGRCLRTFQGHTHKVTSVCLSADCRWALSGSETIVVTGHARLWELSTGRCIRTFQGHTVCMSADGRWALSGHWDHTLRLWEVSTGRCARTLQGHTSFVQSVTMTANGRWALSGGQDNTLRLWEVCTGRCIRTFHGHSGIVTCVCLSSDGRWALSGSQDEALRLWDLRMLTGGGQPFVTSPMVCRVAGVEKTVQVQAEFTRLLRMAHCAAKEKDYRKVLDLVRQARILPGKERSKETLDLQEVAACHCVRNALRAAWSVRTFEGHTSFVQSVSMSADGQWAISGSAEHTLRLWEVSTGRCVRTFKGHTENVSSVSMSADGQWAVSGSDDHTLRLWEVSTGRCVRTFQGHSDDVTSVCFSPDGRWALSGSEDKTLRLWEVSTGRCLRTFQGHTDEVTSVCFSPDGRWVLSASRGTGQLVHNRFELGDNMLRLWEVSTGRCVRAFQESIDRVTSTCISANGRWVLDGLGNLSGRDNSLRLWEVSTGRRVRTFEGHTDSISSVSISADGRWALSGSKDHTLRLWEVSTGRCVRTFEGHTANVTSVCMSADGRWALSGSYDQTLRLWELDWQCEFPGWADWHKAARPYLEVFLARHTPYALSLPAEGTPNEQQIQQGLTRWGRPTWTENDFKQLRDTLANAGLGWLRQDGVREKLERMAAGWKGPSPLEKPSWLRRLFKS